MGYFITAQSALFTALTLSVEHFYLRHHSCKTHSIPLSYFRIVPEG